MFSSEKKIFTDDKHYPYFVVDNFIEKNDYKILKEEFNILVSRIKNWGEEYGVQFCDNKKLKKPILLCWGKSSPDSFNQILNLCSDLPSFKKLLYSLSKEETYTPFFKFKKKVKIYKINEKISFFDYFTKINARISIKISRLQPGSGIAIHRDSKDKILAMLLYMGFNDNIERDYGGTQIYKLNNEGKKKNEDYTSRKNPDGLDHYYFSHEKFEKIADIAPYSNRLFGFVRNENSWHGVKPFDISSKKNIFRDTLQINLVKHGNYVFSLMLLKKIKNFILFFKGK